MTDLHRLVVITEAQFRPGAVLLEATMQAVRRQPTIEAVAVINSAKSPAGGRVPAAARGLAVDLTHRLINPGNSVPFNREWATGIAWTAARHGFDLMEPPGNDLNSPEFIDRLTTEVRPTMALVFGSLQIFRAPLLEALGRVVNYHNGLVPDYRGLRATSWSIYNGEDRTGFTFHDMVLGIDEGPILRQGSIPVEPGTAQRCHRYRKTMAAAAVLPDVIEQLAAGTPGVPQPAGGSYYSGRAGRAITTIDDPGSLTGGEIRRRLAAFAELTISIGGRQLPVTALESSAAGARLAFSTLDGERLRPSRLHYVPPQVYKGLLWGRRLRSGR